MLPRDLTLLPTFQQQNISIKIDTTTQEYHTGDQKHRDGSIRVSVCYLCRLATYDFLYIFFLYSDAYLLNKMLERVVYKIL